jgi:chromosome segregation ATPase
MKISSLLREAENSNQGTVKGLPVDRDLIYRARNKYPGYSSEQAMILLIADEMKNQENTDSNQNKLIDTQKRENARLRSVVNDLGQSVEQEIQQVAQQAEINDREIEKIKQLSGTLNTGSKEATRKAKLSTDDLEKLNKDLEILKNKPGMDPEKFKQLEQQIKLMASNPSTDDADLAKINSLLDTLTKQKEIGDELYNKVENQLSKTQEELNKKENRFANYIDKKKGEVGTMQKTHADEIQKYAEIVKGYQGQIENFGKEMEQAKNQIQTDRNEIEAMKQRVEKQALNINSLVAGTTSKPDIDWLPKGDAANQQQQLKLAEENPAQQIRNDQGVMKLVTTRNYIDWKDKHIFGIFRLFKLKYNGFINKYGHSDKQIQDELIKYLPYLYNLGDPSTPLSPKEVVTWMEEYVLPALQKEVPQYDVLRQGLHETYSRMLDNIIGLPYIKG